MIHEVVNVRTELTGDLLEHIRDELNEAEPRKAFDAACFVDMWGKLIAHNIGAIWLLTNDSGLVTGATGAIAHTEPVEGVLVVAQAFLFLRRDFRQFSDALSLLNAVEEFAKARNASRVVASVCYDTLDGKQAEFLDRRGYAPYETRFYKNLWEQKP